LTGYPDVNLAVEFMKQGAVEYLVKPLEKEQLIDAVEKAAAKRTLFSGNGGQMKP
jgi:FixJ family two-component response regulator